MSTKPPLPPNFITFTKTSTESNTFSNSTENSDNPTNDTKEKTPETKKPQCQIQWRCPLPSSKKVITDCEMYMMNIMRKHAGSRPIRCNIRRGPHPDTRASNGRMVPDVWGYHTTAEYLDPKDNMWYQLHLYLVRVDDDTYVLNKSLSPNPSWASQTLTSLAARWDARRTEWLDY